jgi:hypothetical protein
MKSSDRAFSLVFSVPVSVRSNWLLENDGGTVAKMCAPTMSDFLTKYMDIEHTISR